MPFKLEEVDVKEDFDELIACEWEAYYHPPQGFFHLYFPVLGTGPNAEAEALREATARQLQLHQGDPTSYWQKVVNPETGKIVAGALWKICEKNPFETDDEQTEVEVADWYPEGSRREFSTWALERFNAPRKKVMRRPHFYLNILFTHSQFRKRGAGDLVLLWGLKKADEMGLEMWIDASQFGAPLYTKHGFITICETHYTTENDRSDDEEWTKMVGIMAGESFKHMWRPKFGRLEEGQEIPRYEP